MFSETTMLSHEEVLDELVKLLSSFDAFCSLHGLRYSLDGGTLLGAVRHRGFIPWDDDIDVSMPRPDYDMLLSLKDALPAGCGLILPGEPGYSCPFSKYVNKSIAVQEASTQGKFQSRLWIDIFPMDGAFDQDELVCSMQKKINISEKMLAWKLYGPQPGDSVFKKMIKSIVRIAPKTILIDHMARVSSEIRDSPGYDSASRVSGFLGLAKKGWTLSKSQYESTSRMLFEGKEFSVMDCWDEYLTFWYGDYMRIPPEEERVTHCYKAWRCQ